MALRYAALKDRLDAAKQNCVCQCSLVDASCQFPTMERYASDFLRGCPLADIAKDLAGRSAFAAQAEDFKSALYQLLVAPAEKSLEDFQKSNKHILAKLPLHKLKCIPEPPFTPVGPVDEWGDGIFPKPPTATVRAMLGLRPGELAPSGTNAPFDRPSNGKMINDLDDDN